MYNQDQLKTILPYVGRGIGWMVLGGPADGNEAQCARKVWPGVCVIGIEPIAELVQWQRNNGWPSDCLLLNAALGRVPGKTEVLYHQDDPRSSRLRSTHPESHGEVRVVPSVTLDDIYAQYVGHCTGRKILLWLDIEGSELDALNGGMSLVNSKDLYAVNVEVMYRRTEYNARIHTLLTDAGLAPKLNWNQHSSHQDTLYVRIR